MKEKEWYLENIEDNYSKKVFFEDREKAVNAVKDKFYGKYKEVYGKEFRMEGNGPYYEDVNAGGDCWIDTETGEAAIGNDEKYYHWKARNKVAEGSFEDIIEDLWRALDGFTRYQYELQDGSCCEGHILSAMKKIEALQEKEVSA